MRAISWVAPAEVGPVPTICSLTSPATTQTTLVLFCVSSEHTQASARNGLKVHVPASYLELKQGDICDLLAPTNTELKQISDSICICWC